MQGAHEGRLVLEAALDCVEGRLEVHAGDVGPGSVEPGNDLVLGEDRLHEAPVLGGLERRRVPARRIHAERLLPHVAQHALVDAGGVAEDGDSLEAELGVLLEEAQAVDAGEPGVDAVDVGLDLADISAVLGHVERRPQLLHNAAAVRLERALEARRALVAVGEVVGHGSDALDAELLGGEFAQNVHGLRGGADCVDDVIVELLLRQVLLRGGSRRDKRDLSLPDVVVDGERLEGRERADDDVHVVALDELLGPGFRLRRVAASVADEKLDLASRQGVVALLEEQHDALFHLRAAGGERAGLDGEKAEPQRLGLRRRARMQDAQRCRERQDANAAHANLSLRASSHIPSSWSTRRKLR